MLRSLIHFEFIFVYGVRKCSSFILLQVVYQFSQHHLLKRLSFLRCVFLPPLSKIWCPLVRGFICGLSIFSIDLYFCLCVSTILSWWLWLCSRAWSQADWFLPFHSSFSRLLWLFKFLYFHINCELICSSSVKNTVGSFIGIALNLWIALGSILIFTILILPIHEHGIFLHLLVSFWFLSPVFCTFLCIGLLFL